MRHAIALIVIKNVADAGVRIVIDDFAHIKLGRSKDLPTPS